MRTGRTVVCLVSLCVAAAVQGKEAGYRFEWVRTNSGPEQGDSGVDLAIDADSSIFVVGHHSGLDLDRDGIVDDTPAATTELDGFVVRLDSRGGVRWMRALSGPAPEMVRSVTQAGNGDLLVTGGIYGATDFDGNGVPDATVARDERKAFLARYTPEGALAWVRVYGPETAYHVTAHGDRIAMTGLYKGPLDFDGDGRPDGQAAADGKSEGFAAILDGEGRLQHLFTIVGPAADQARAAGFSHDGEKLFVTGFVRLAADFDGDGVPEGAVQCDELGDMFIAGYHLGR